jgi:hypothetical protein
MARLRAYINPFNDAGDAYTGWVEITKHLLLSGLGSLSKRLDVSEYDIGVFTNSAIKIELINADGDYSDVDAGTSIFGFKRSDSKFKLTWDAADQDYVAGFARSDDVLGHEFTLFEGVLSDESTLMQVRSQKINFDVLGYEALLDRELIDATWSGSLPASNLASNLLKRALAIAAAASSVPILTIDNARIVPSNDITWDNISVFTNMSIRDAVNMILTASNSVLYMDGTTPVVSGRTPGVTAAKTFYGPGSQLGNENILDIKDVSSGLNRTLNVLTWTTSENPPTVNLISQDVSSKIKYGARKKNVTVDGITTTATQQAIIDAIRTEFANPKQELVLVTTMTPETVVLLLLDQILIDYPLVPLGSDASMYGSAIYDLSEYADEVSTFVIDTGSPYKVIGIDFEPKVNQMQLNLRRI